MHSAFGLAEPAFERFERSICCDIECLTVGRRISFAEASAMTL